MYKAITEGGLSSIDQVRQVPSEPRNTYEQTGYPGSDFVKRTQFRPGLPSSAGRKHARWRGPNASNEPNWPGSGWSREIRSTNLETRNKSEIRMIENVKRTQLGRFWPENEDAVEKQSQSQQAKRGACDPVKRPLRRVFQPVRGLRRALPICFGDATMWAFGPRGRRLGRPGSVTYGYHST